MARVPYVGEMAGSGPNELQDIYGYITEHRGSVINLYRAIANQPNALRAFMDTSRYIREGSELPPRLRELATLATAYVLDAPYERLHHIPIARRVGVTEEQLAAFPRWQDHDCFSPVERAVLAYADQVARTRDVDDATFAAVREHLSVGATIDLVLTVAWYHCVAAILGPLHVDLEAKYLPSE